MKDILPWQFEAWKAFTTPQDRFAHAWLLYGASGTGKLAFAQAAAQALLCEAILPDRSACGQCQACVWHLSGNHPDFCRVCPEALDPSVQAEEDGDGTKSGKTKTPSKEIRIDQIRALQERISVAPFRGGRRVILLYPADALNLASANALLKTLEEPPPHTVFLLVCDRPARLLPTVISRCRKLAIPFPSKAESLAWLHSRDVTEAESKLSAVGGAPLAVVRAEADGGLTIPSWVDGLLAPQVLQPVEMADSLADQSLSEVVNTLQKVMFDLCLHRSAGRVRYYPEKARTIGTLAAQAQLQSLSAFARLLTDDKKVANHPLNARLFLADLLARYRSVFLSGT